MAETGNTDFGKSVSGVLIRDGKVLLGRHTYGGGKGLLIIPGGYIQQGEAPEDAVVREFLEETGVTVRPGEILGIRFNTHDWYVIFRVEYLSGEAVSDHDENSEVLWLDVNEALSREDVPLLTKQAIMSATGGGSGLAKWDGQLPGRWQPSSLYRV